MLVGREREIAALREVLDGARGGEGGALVLSGEAGIGKTALLGHAESLCDGFRVIRVAGVEPEQELPFAALDRLLRPLLSRIEGLPAPQAEALGGALGLASEREPSPFLIGAAALSLLADAADQQPLAVLVDDAHWFDVASAAAVGFVARRLQGERIALLVVVRGDAVDVGFAGVPTLPVGPLSEAEVDALIDRDAGGRVSREGRRLVRAVACGNPLAVTEMLVSLAAGVGPSMVGPALGAVERGYAARVARLDAGTRMLLVLAASEGSSDLAAVSAAAAAVELDVDDLRSAEEDGLVWVADGRVLFRHPLVRAAAYGTASFVERRRAHAAWAQVLVAVEDADRRAWHLAAAATGRDEAVAVALEETAERAVRRSGYGSAAAALERAAQLSGSALTRSRRQVAAAGAAWNAGRPSHARRLVEEAAALELEPLTRAELLFVQGSIELTAGAPQTAVGLFLDAAATAQAAGDDARALDLLALATNAAGAAADMETIGEAARRAGSLDPAGAGPSQSLLAGMGALVCGQTAEAIPLLEQTIEAARMLDDPRALGAWAAASAISLGQDEVALELLSRAVAAGRERGALAPLVLALERRGYIYAWHGAAADSEIDAVEAAGLAEEAGLANSVVQSRATRALIAAIRGEESGCHELAEQALRDAAARGLAHAWGTASWALALCDLGAARWDEATDRLLQLADPRPGRVNPWVAVRCVPDLAEAAARAGRSDEAKDAVARFEAWSAGLAAPWADGASMRARAMLEDDKTAIPALEQTLAADRRTGWPFEMARAQLVLGERLRRQLQRTQARAHLRQALELFDRVGAAPWAARAEAELRATGETARRRDPSTLGQLTPQELQIGRLVAEGLTNREIAGQLFLSHRTVEYHLRKVFQKLGIASRSELIKLGLDTA